LDYCSVELVIFSGHIFVVAVHLKQVMKARPRRQLATANSNCAYIGRIILTNLTKLICAPVNQKGTDILQSLIIKIELFNFVFCQL